MKTQNTNPIVTSLPASAYALRSSKACHYGLYFAQLTGKTETIGFPGDANHQTIQIGKACNAAVGDAHACKWSGSQGLPRIGETVTIGHSYKCSGVVVAYFIEDGWLGCELVPQTRPAHVNTKTHPHALMFGLDLTRKELAPAVSRAVVATFKDGTCNQITIPHGRADAQTDAEAVTHARDYFTDTERSQTTLLHVIINRADGSASSPLPVPVPADWMPSTIRLSPYDEPSPVFPDAIRDLNDAKVELRLCKELLGEYARNAVTNHAETFRRIGVAETVIANIRATLTKAEGRTL